MKFKTHELSINLKYKKGVVVDKISHVNPYDFKQIHRHNYYEILIFFTENNGEQIIDFKNYKLREKSIYIINPGQIHLMKNNPDENGISIQFTEEFLNMNFSSFRGEWIESLQKHTELFLTDSRHSELLNLSKKLLINFENENALSFQKVINYISLMLSEILELIMETNELDNFKQNSVSQKFVSLVQKEIRTKRNVQEYATLINISTNKLNTKVREGLGKSPKEIIQEYLLLEIKRLIVINEFSHKEISCTLNFDSQNSYNRFINKYTNKTPSELKKELIEIHK